MALHRFGGGDQLTKHVCGRVAAAMFVGGDDRLAGPGTLSDIGLGETVSKTSVSQQLRGVHLAAPYRRYIALSMYPPSVPAGSPRADRVAEGVEGIHLEWCPHGQVDLLGARLDIPPELVDHVRC